MGNIKASVIIPVYNAEKYLQQCLDSVINQTLKDIEIICVDDGSTDKSADIILEYSRRDTRIISLRQNNLGAGVARNKGIQFAKGEYVAFIDSDDYYSDDYALEALFSAAKKNNARICGGSISFLRRGKIVPAELGGIKYYFLEDGWIDYKEFQQDFYYQRFIYSREMLIDNGLLFPYYRRYQDPPFFVRAMLFARNFYAISTTVYVYREGSSVMQWTPQKVYDRLEGIYDELEQTRKAELFSLHFRIVSRIKNVLNSIRNETNLADTVYVKEAFLKIYRAIDKKSIIREYGKSYELELLEEYLADLLEPQDKMDEYVLERKATAYLDGTVPKVSLIVPVYNVEAYLKVCMDSVVNQTLKEIEIICVNDETEDNSGQILLDYADKDNRITVIKQKNKGLSGARNRGLSFAKGEYVYFLDSDDYLQLDAMEVLYLECKEKALDAVYFDYSRFYDDGTTAPPMERSGYENVCDGVSLLKRFRDDKAFTQTAWAQMARRDFLRQNNISFYEGIIHEDNLYTFYVLMKAKRVSHVSRKLYNHRLRANSIMTVPVSMKNVEGYFVSMKEILCFGIKNTGSEKKQNEIWRYFDHMRKQVGWNIAKLSPEERANLHFKDPFSQLLFETFVLQDNAVKTQEPKPEHTQADTAVKCREQQRKNDARVSLLEQEIKNIHSSATYKIGRIITWLPRKIRGGIRCYKQNGARYTFERILVHLKLKKEVKKSKIPPVAKMDTPATSQSIPTVIQGEIKRDYEFYFNLEPDRYEEELKRWYTKVTKKELDLDNPKTFNEKIQWMKLYDSTPIKTKLADKYLVREYVSEKIGEEYLIPLLGVWDNFDQIDFDKLPDSFVLKANHGCGWNVIVRDKSKFDRAEAKSKFDIWMKKNFGFNSGLELQYLNIEPKIIAEEYIENGEGDIFDYKVFCFGGKAESIMFLSNRQKGLQMAFYDLEWNKLPFVYSFPRMEGEVKKPERLELLIELSEKLAADFPHVRVDFYILNDGSIKFGEMTFTSASGACAWNPPEQNLIYGNLIKLPPKSPIPERKK